MLHHAAQNSVLYRVMGSAACATQVRSLAKLGAVEPVNVITVTLAFARYRYLSVISAATVGDKVQGRGHLAYGQWQSEQRVGKHITQKSPARPLLQGQCFAVFCEPTLQGGYGCKGLDDSIRPAKTLGKQVPTWIFCLIAAGLFSAWIVTLFIPPPFNPVFLIIPAVVITLGVLNRIYPQRK